MDTEVWLLNKGVFPLVKVDKALFQELFQDNNRATPVKDCFLPFLESGLIQVQPRITGAQEAEYRVHPIIAMYLMGKGDDSSLKEVDLKWLSEACPHVFQTLKEARESQNNLDMGDLGMKFQAESSPLSGIMWSWKKRFPYQIDDSAIARRAK